MKPEDIAGLTLASARDGLRAKRFSATELTKAFIANMEAARPLNAYVLETPEKALAMAAASDARLAKGEGGPLEGLPLGIKDLFCTEGVRTTACSNILGNFVPTYESTVTTQLWRDGAVMLGKLNKRRVRHGSSNETSCFGTPVNPWRAAGDNRQLVAGGSSGGSAAAVAADICLAATATDTAARSASRPPSPAPSASSRPMAGLALGDRRLRLVARPGGPIGKTVRDNAIMLRSMAAMTRRTRPRSIARCRTTRRR